MLNRCWWTVYQPKVPWGMVWVAYRAYQTNLICFPNQIGELSCSAEYINIRCGKRKRLP
ncbi:AgrD family cyclic lactone autoinducer peptide [Olivibacter oleidegradans]|uniref:AgrD family cyclic lactone autoinducer peptide n=1 Tax=Olivibacter oleidegradans TaxID=760123 RepID=A0ABV6HHT6_9SPHI